MANAVRPLSHGILIHTFRSTIIAPFRAGNLRGSCDIGKVMPSPFKSPWILVNVPQNGDA